ncbi:MAG: hypothetical protein GY940_07920, partial [bacterium]|nr:hypothetical protein [bacterium]
STIFNFFEDRVQKVPCLAEPECGDLYIQVSHLQRYLARNPSFADELITEFKELYGKIADIMTKQVLISLLCQSQSPQALAFIKSIYNDEKKLQEWIIEKLSGNQQAVDFLFEKYHAGQAVKEQVVKSLLKSEQGLQYFIKHFFTFDLDKQEMVIQSLTFSNQSYLLDFIREIYRSELYSLKCYLLHVLRDNFLFEFEDVLFDPKQQREFAFMGDDYMQTILRLFPIATVKMLYQKVAFEDISFTKIKKYLESIRQVAENEIVLDFKDTELVNKLFNKVVNANNIELNTQFYAALENIKIMDIQSYKYLLDSTATFVNVRGAQISQKEKAAVNKFKKNLHEQVSDIRDIEGLGKELKTVFATKPINKKAMEKILKARHFAIAVNIETVIPFLADRLSKPEYISRDDRELLFITFPVMGKMIENYTANAAKPQAGASDIFKLFNHDSRIVISFNNKALSALIKDQLREVLPQFRVALDVEADGIVGNDILLCDVPVLKNYIKKNAVTGNHIYLFLEHRADYAQFRDYNPRAFMRPISAHRIVKLMLKELYLEG